MKAVLENPTTGDCKAVSTGFDFIHFVSPLLLGIPFWWRGMPGAGIACLVMLGIAFFGVHFAFEAVIDHIYVNDLTNAEFVSFGGKTYDGDEFIFFVVDDGLVKAGTIAAAYLVAGLIIGFFAGLTGGKTLARKLMAKGYRLAPGNEQLNAIAKFKWGITNA